MPNRVQRTCDKTVVVLMVLLLLMGLVTLFSATYYQKAATGDALAAVKKQLIGVALGAAACVTLSRVPYRVFRRPKVTLLLLATSALLLILVIIPGVGVSINGSRRWLNFFGLSMQPSEFAKYAMVIFMAGALDRRGEAIRHLFTGIVPLLVVPGVMFLLILEQPNLSTGGSILICALVMLFAAGIQKRHMALLGAGGLVVGAFYAWSAPYRRERLLSFRDPFAGVERRGIPAFAIADCARFGRAVRYGAGAGTAEIRLPAVSGIGFHFCDCRRGLRDGWLRDRDRAVCFVCAGGSACIAGLP